MKFFGYNHKKYNSSFYFSLSLVTSSFHSIYFANSEVCLKYEVNLRLFGGEFEI